MATVRLELTALPEHVRTARLVATAVARRLGLGEELLEEVRLAVGEACARAVQRSEQMASPGTVRVDLSDDDERLVVEVADDAGGEPPDGVAGDLSLMLVEGLADRVVVGADPGGRGGRLRLEWDASAGRDRPSM